MPKDSYYNQRRELLKQNEVQTFTDSQKFAQFSGFSKKKSQNFL